MKKDELQRNAHFSASTTLKPAIQAWRLYLQDQGNSPHTLTAFLSDLNLLASYLPPDQTLSEITTIDLNQFLDWMQHKRDVACSPKTLARRITSLKSFFNWVFRYQVIMQNPAEAVVQHSVISPIPIILSDDEVERLMDTAQQYRIAAKPDARYYTLLKLLLLSGIKKNECLGIYLNHIDSEDPEAPFFFVRYANPQYRYKERKISLSPDWLEAYHEYIEQYSIRDQLFIWSQRRLEYLLEDLSREANIGKHVSFDMCRWTCAMHDWRAGEDHNKIREKLGLSKIQWREIGMKLTQLAAGAEANPSA